MPPRRQESRPAGERPVEVSEQLGTLQNRWRTKRQGLRGPFIDPATRRAVPFASWLDDLLEQLLLPYTAEDEPPTLLHARTLAREGGRAEAQLRAYREARAVACSHARRWPVWSTN